MKKRKGFYFPKVIYHHAIGIQDILISLVLFFIILFRLYPPLLYELQRPIFFTDWNFLKEHLLLPGGSADYISALFTQAFEYPVFGALLIAGMIALVSIFTRKIIHILWKAQIHTVHWIPGIFLLFLYANYRAPLSLAIGTAIVLICIWIFFRWAPKSTGLRICLYTLFTGLLYWFCGGPFLLFPIFCAIWEWIKSKSLVTVAIYLLVSAIWCVIGPTFLFLVLFPKDIINNLTIEGSYTPAFARWGFLLFFPLIGFLSFLILKFRKTLEIKFKRVKIQTWTAGTVLILSAFFVGGWFLLDSSSHKHLMLFRAGRKNNWKVVLQLGKDPSIMNLHTCVQVNRALCYTGQLLDSTFAYPQWNSPIGLIPDSKRCFENPESASNLFFELGLISESLHWSNELMEALGQIPEILDRIGMIYLLKGEIKPAKMFWKRLKHTLQGRKKANYLLNMVKEKNFLEENKTLLGFSSFIPDFDFVSLGNVTDRELLILLKQNPGNRMAFEYWVAYQLFNGNLKSIWNNIDKFRAFGYSRIPRHVQEAVILYAYLSKWTQLDSLQPYVDYSLVQDFSKFQKVLAQYQTNKSSTHKALKQEFGDTYWYYLTFVRLIKR